MHIHIEKTIVSDTVLSISKTNNESAWIGFFPRPSSARFSRRRSLSVRACLPSVCLFFSLLALLTKQLKRVSLPL